MDGPLRVGIGGPVGSGKTALTLALCRALRDQYDIAAVTNDIYTEEDARFLVTNEALAPAFRKERETVGEIQPLRVGLSPHRGRAYTFGQRQRDEESAIWLRRLRVRHVARDAGKARIQARRVELFEPLDLRRQ